MYVTGNNNYCNATLQFKLSGPKHFTTSFICPYIFVYRENTQKLSKTIQNIYTKASILFFVLAQPVNLQMNPNESKLKSQN